VLTLVILDRITQSVGRPHKDASDDDDDDDDYCGFVDFRIP